MSEKLQRSPESEQNNHEIQASEESKKNIERIKQLAEQEKEASKEQVDSLKETVESLASRSEDLSVEAVQENRDYPAFDQRELKRTSYKKTMKKVQADLPPVQRALSKVVHQKTIETVSEAGGKTIARPSGVLGGGLIVCLGSLVVLYFARHYGFEYNYSLFIILYVVGFGGGILFELIVKRTRKN